MKKIGLTSFYLHIIAMLLMLSDHLWATFFGNQRWMTGVGRIAFPIFAFMIAEGFCYTSNIKRYLKRLFIFALISEIPFNLLMSGRVIGPFHQNVLWTFLIALLLILLMNKINTKAEGLIEKISNEKVATSVKYLLSIVVAIIICYIGYFIGNITFVDYFGAGILTVLVFYIFRKRRWWNLIFQIICLYYINAELLAGMCIPVQIGSFKIEFAEQALAVLALIPIWIYNGKQGYHSKFFKYFCYGFYPAHMLILSVLSRII